MFAKFLVVAVAFEFIGPIQGSSVIEVDLSLSAVAFLATYG